MSAVTVPAAMRDEFDRFKRNWLALERAWIDRGVETAAEMAVCREGLRRYIADTSDPDEYGVRRTQRLLNLFDWCRDLCQREHVHSIVPAHLPPPRAAAGRAGGH